MKNKILFVVLNWGLGHATRSIPIIRHLQQLGFYITLASDGNAARLLAAEFPELPLLSLPSYGVRYSQHFFLLNMLWQLPKIGFAIIREKLKINTLIKKEKFNILISDSRYGCFHRNIPTVFITHQLNLPIPNAFFRWAANLINHFFLSLFSEVWIPDQPQGKKGLLSSDLSDTTRLPSAQTRRFLGILSRFEKEDRNVSSATNKDVLVVLSGPEPQRTIFEKIILKQAESLPYSFLVVQGLPNIYKKELYFHQNNIKIIPYLTSRELNMEMLKHKYIISRSGYTTVLDLFKIEKNAILVPTPNQYEQEYLATHLAKTNLFVLQTQKDFNLESALKTLETKHFNIEIIHNLLETNISLFLEKYGLGDATKPK